MTVTGTLTATTLTGALSTTDACQTGDLTILNGNPDLRLKDSNHGGNNTEHMIAFQDSSEIIKWILVRLLVNNT